MLGCKAINLITDPEAFLNAMSAATIVDKVLNSERVCFAEVLKIVNWVVTRIVGGLIYLRTS